MTDDELERLMFITAKTFEDVSRMTFQQMDAGKVHLGFVYGANGALSIELFLKCLLTIVKTPFPRTHDLLKLFKLLPIEVQRDIEATHADRASKDRIFLRLNRIGMKTDLATLLEEGKDTFEKFRYPYEGFPSGEKLAFGLGIFGECIADLILDLRPDWIQTTSPVP
jgi:hypothetical protein